MSTDIAASLPRRGLARDALLVALLLLVTTAVGLAVERHLTVTSGAMLYMLAVVVASYTVGMGAALACAVAAVVLLNFFFIDPRYAFRVAAQENLTAMVAMLAVSLVVSQRGVALRRETAAAHLSEARARQLQDLATRLAEAESAEAVRKLAQEALDQAFPGGCQVALLGEGGALRPDPGPQLRERMHACIAGSDPSPPRAPGKVLPLASEDEVLGAAHAAGLDGADARGVEHARAICSLVGQALWRMQLAADSLAAEQRSQWHRTQTTFLAGVSHDFRTPLAAIVTAASSLQTQRDKLPEAEQDRLVHIILDEAAHLSTLTENTLNLARLTEAADLDLDWQSIEEIVGSVLARIRQRDPGRRIHSRVPPGLPLIHADPVLLMQLLENLLDNALKYSRNGIDLEAAEAGPWLEVSVHDRGAGIAPGQEDAIFEPYRRADRSGQRGAGLGLAVCRAIARAHGGELVVRRRDGGGSTFTLRLPVEPLPAPPPAA